MLFKTIQNTYIGRSFKTLHCIFIGRSFKTLHSTYKGRSLKTIHNTYKGSSFKTLHCTYIGRSFKTIHNTYLGKTLYIVSRSSWALTVAQLSAVRIGSSILYCQVSHGLKRPKMCNDLQLQLSTQGPWQGSIGQFPHYHLL